MALSKREKSISRSILQAIFQDSTKDKRSTVALILAFFTFLRITLVRVERALFQSLRTTIWKIDEDEYKESFRSSKSKGTLKPIGDLGYSGSSFFSTENSKFLVKSLPRRFEYSFFRDDMLQPYYDHMRQHPSSLLVRITDFLQSKYTTLGGLLSLVPTHHIVMENILYGKEFDENADHWETYDLKPASYFFPERDIMNGNLASQSTIDRLVDKFEDKIRITNDQFEELKRLLSADTDLLMRTNAVDYSLFLVRFPTTSHSKLVPSKTSEWRTGVASTDNKWKYRAVVLDFFWAKHKLQAQAMTRLVRTFNFFARKGPMSITTTPEEYRERFYPWSKIWLKSMAEASNVYLKIDNIGMTIATQLTTYRPSPHQSAEILM